MRFFVDALLEVGDLSSEDRARIDAEVKAKSEGRTLDAVLREATSLLSGLSRGAGVVVTTKNNARLKHVEFVQLEPRRALVVLVSDDGSVENRVVALPPGLPASALTEATNFLNARILGKTLAELRAELQSSRAAVEREIDALTAGLIEAGLASWTGGGDDPAIDRARPGEPPRGSEGRPRISNGCASFSPISRRSARSSISWRVPRRARACASSSARRTSCSRSPARP